MKCIEITTHPLTMYQGEVEDASWGAVGARVAPRRRPMLTVKPSFGSFV